MNRFLKLLGSKTVWGTVVAAGGYLLNQPRISTVEVLTAAGIIVAGIGVKDGQNKVEQKVDQATGATVKSPLPPPQTYR